MHHRTTAASHHHHHLRSFVTTHALHSSSPLTPPAPHPSLCSDLHLTSPTPTPHLITTSAHSPHTLTPHHTTRSQSIRHARTSPPTCTHTASSSPPHLLLTHLCTCLSSHSLPQPAPHPHCTSPSLHRTITVPPAPLLPPSTLCAFTCTLPRPRHERCQARSLPRPRR